ncbi:lipopolysaccharide heptosyltransferase RfaC [Thorsellia kenyensis]|uniref:Lipopolysaccharide heptosyltransferase 1 n=1 Tax=Thorsellia kenyensis TaxID=1549888 RepID=A0ABV6CCQ8_9GAMM
MKILLVKTSSMGDILHTLPALTDALSFFPQIQVDWVVEENFAQIPSWHKTIRRVIPIALRRWRKSWFAKETREERFKFLAAIKSEQYDLIIDAQGLIKSALFVVRHARGTKHGYSFKSAREGLASFFYDKRHTVATDLHAVERIRMLFAQSLGYQLPISVGNYDIASYFQDRHSAVEASNLSGEAEKNTYLIFLHSTTRDEKHWPENHWLELIRLIAPLNYKIKLPWGTDKEKQRAERLAEDFDFIEVLPKLNLYEVANEIAHCKAVISVDTGLSHLTAALSKHNITLYGPTDPNLIGGYGINQNALTSPTGQMKDILPLDVFEKLKLLN